MVKLKGKDNLILVVDDSPDTLGMLNHAIEKANMTTLVALEGTQAIAIAKKMHPDVILLDAVMPNMDGFETCRRIKEDIDLKNIPIVFMTGLTDTESIVKGFEVGGVDYLTKPINPQELIARINVHLMNARRTQSVQTALDTSGQSICALSLSGEKLWATPMVEKLLLKIERAQASEALEAQLATWLSHSPNDDDRCRFKSEDISIEIVYVGLSSNEEYLVRMVESDAFDEKEIMRMSFNITVRESEVLEWLAKGKTNREIAQILDLSPRTVNKHLEQLFKKLDVDNRTTAAAKAILSVQKVTGVLRL